MKMQVWFDQRLASWAIGVFTFLVLALAMPATSQAFRGANGRIAYESNQGGADTEIMSGAIDGSGSTQLTSNTVDDRDPAWSPDGKKIAFAHFNSGTGKFEIWTMNFDGTGQAALVTNAGNSLTQPSWNADGTRIAYQFQYSPSDDDIYRADTSGLNVNVTAVAAGGANERNPVYVPRTGLLIPANTILFSYFAGSNYRLEKILDNGASQTPFFALAGHDLTFPNWSPSGGQVVFQYTFSAGDEDIWKVYSDGTVPTAVASSGLNERNPAYSPEAQMFTFDFAGGDTEVRTSNRDGTFQMALESRPATTDTNPDWRPITAAQVRPVSATPMYLPLLPAFQGCPYYDVNAIHDPPLSYDSCVPAQQQSPDVTVGEPLVNGKAAKFGGFIRIKALAADAEIAVSLTDVRCAHTYAGCTGGPLSDFTGSLSLEYSFQLTDRANTGGWSGTSEGNTISAPVPCTATSGDPTVGSTCGTTTTINTIVGPGAVVSGKRAGWELLDAVVRDPTNAPAFTPGTFIP